METALSTVLRESTRTFEIPVKEAEMNIAEYITLLRNTLYLSGKVESASTSTGGKTADGLGEILINMNSAVTKGEISRSIQNYRQAIRINPDDPEAHFNLGISCLLLKDRRAALEEYRILKNMNHRMADELLQRWNIGTPWSYRH